MNILQSFYIIYFLSCIHILGVVAFSDYLFVVRINTAYHVYVIHSSLTVPIATGKQLQLRNIYVHLGYYIIPYLDAMSIYCLYVLLVCTNLSFYCSCFVLICVDCYWYLDLGNSFISNTQLYTKEYHSIDNYIFARFSIYDLPRHAP